MFAYSMLSARLIGKEQFSETPTSSGIVTSLETYVTEDSMFKLS